MGTLRIKGTSFPDVIGESRFLILGMDYPVKPDNDKRGVHIQDD
jgi:hypothetical protein